MLCYKTLGLISFFTVGPEEVRAWTDRQESLPPQAAGVIHSDFERRFIRAEVMKYQDLVRLGSEQKVSFYLFRFRNYWPVQCGENFTEPHSAFGSGVHEK
jgi:ribosome-binding ATPase YchF (GTP1/OBG family)